MASEASPRINARYLEQFLHQTVRIVGKVTSLQGETAKMDAEGNVNIQLNRDAHLALGNAAEIIGKVQPDLSVKVFQCTDWGSNIDYAACNVLVEATHKYKDIFYEPQS